MQSVCSFYFMPSASPSHSKGITTCISITSCCCRASQRDIYTVKWCKGPHSNSPMQIVPQKSHFHYSQHISASSWSFYMFAKHKNNLWHRVWIVLSNNTFLLYRKAPSQVFRKPMTLSLKMKQHFPRMRFSKVLLLMLGFAHTKGDGPKKSYRGECSVWASSFCKSLWSRSFDVCVCLSEIRSLTWI